MSSDIPELEEIVTIAKEAGNAIMRVYEREDFGETEKADHSPLTQADMDANRIIIERLTALTPDIPALSEESKSVPYEVRSKWDRYWLIDPLDGTKEFIRRNGEFTVNIALIEGQNLVMGVVHAPAINLTVYAEKGGGAFQETMNSEPMSIKVRDRKEGEKLIVVASRSHRTPEIDQFLENLNSPYDCISVGSSLKLIMVANGSAHIYPRLGPTMEWDTAAAHCVVESAGGKVTKLDGSDLTYNKPDMLNPFFLATNGQSVAGVQLI